MHFFRLPGGFVHVMHLRCITDAGVGTHTALSVACPSSPKGSGRMTALSAPDAPVDHRRLRPRPVPRARHGASTLDAAEVHHAGITESGTQNMHRSMGRSDGGHASCPPAVPLVAWDVRLRKAALTNGLMYYPAEV